MSRLKILLVDDEPITGMALTAWLQKCGHQTVYASGTAEAEAAFAVEQFDLVLSDIQMPGNFRLEWVECFLQAECPPPLLLMTASPELETAMRAANLPIAGYLLKPLNYDKTAQLIETLAADYRHRRELLALSNEVTRLIETREASSGSSADSSTSELHRLAHKLANDARRTPRDRAVATSGNAWADAILETIAVLERTKHSFRSKELGDLRRRLLQLVPSTPAKPARAAAMITR